MIPASQEIPWPDGALFADTAPFRTDGADGVWVDHSQSTAVGRLVGSAVMDLLGRT
jgi:hypothetical protein